MAISALVKDLADLVADRIVDTLDIEFGGERFLHAVDDGQFGRALLALLEQTLRLVEQARVLQRNAHRVGKGVQQAHVRLAERVSLAGHRLDNADRLVVLQDRHAEML